MMEREKKEKIGVEKRKCVNKGLSELVLGQNKEGSWVIVRWKKIGFLPGRHPPPWAPCVLWKVAGCGERAGGRLDEGFWAAEAEPGFTVTPFPRRHLSQPWLCATPWSWASTRATK
jgi:hypothetical protein